jgi:hypothetical protein
MFFILHFQDSFGDHTKTTETKAILSQHALDKADIFKSYAPSLDSPPPAHLAAAPYLLNFKPTQTSSLNP